MKIHEVLDRDPRGARLANNGQARIDADPDGSDTRAATVLREELETFVCDGRFGDGLVRIVDRYLTNLGSARQDAAWVSGFFGSGKSHLLKMAAHLWRDTTFEDGATARSLVAGRIPRDLEAALRELDTHARRAGQSPVAAAGTLLGGNEWVRRSVLEIVLSARGWPGQYAQAQFCFWLREEGYLDAVRAAIEGAARDWLRELNNLYVSPVLAQALVNLVPGFAHDVGTAARALQAQFPLSRTDITTEQFVDAARKALSNSDELPHTVLVLDEVQQYIGDDGERSSAITELAEAVQTRFDGRLMLVGSGQSALSADTPHFAKLRDRFVVHVQLTDADVEAVTRQILLRKKPSAVPAIEEMFEGHAGEVARQLRNTRIAARREDEDHRVDDYPLLPARRRFWEACFRAVDEGGGRSQLRSQLRILHDSLEGIASEDVGAAIPASDLFSALAPDMVSAGVLLGELHTTIARLDDGTDDGRLRRDLCGLAFLVGKLPREGALDLGVRADASTLADLLVTDIRGDASGFRRKVAEELENLVDQSVLLKVGEEHRLQTTEGAEWEREYRQRVGALRQSEVEIARIRNQLFHDGTDEAVRSLRPTQGDSKERRAVRLHASDDPPPPDDAALIVWLRDGWSCRPKEVEDDARRAGVESPTVFVHLPRRHAEALRDGILSSEAAQRILDLKGSPATAEGRDARAGMESRREEASRRLRELVQETLRAAVVYHGGGTEVFGEGLRDKLDKAARASMARLFPEFPEADHRAWEVALRRARDGSDTPLQIVGWDRPTAEHAVARQILAMLGAGARGTEIHRKLRVAPFGWPQDAVDAVLIALHGSGHVRATRGGAPVAPGALDQAGIKSAEFRTEKIVLTASQRIALRGLFQKAGVQAASGQESLHAAPFLDAMRSLAGEAGGDAPLPPVPDMTFLDELSALAGTEQLAAILGERESIGESLAEWGALAERREARLPAWRQALALRRHARELPGFDSIDRELRAIEQQQSLLDETDQLTPLAGKLAGELRAAVTEQRERLDAAVTEAAGELEVDPAWRALGDADRDAIRRQYRLTGPEVVPISSVAELLASLDECSLLAWQADIDAVRERVSQALAEAAKRAHANDETAKAPTSVTIRRGTLADEAAVREWLAEQEERLIEAVRKGPVVLR